MKNICIYAGTFDPITSGHLDIIERATHLYDEVYVVISDNKDKHCLFTIEERLSFIQESTAQYSNVIIDHTDLLTVEYANKIGAKILLRGLRNTRDYTYEQEIANYNLYLDPSIETVFLLTDPKYQFVSSSGIKEIAQHHRSVEGLVPECVEKALYNKYK